MWGRNDTRVYAILNSEGGGKIKRINEKKVIELLAAMAFTSPAALVSIVEENDKQKIKWKSFEELPEDVKAAIANIKSTPSGINIETIDRLKAVDMLLKHLGIKGKDVKKVIITGESDLEE